MRRALIAIVAPLAMACSSDDRCEPEAPPAGSDATDTTSDTADVDRADSPTDAAGPDAADPDAADAAGDAGSSSLPRDPLPDPAGATAVVDAHCEDHVGPPRVEELAEGLWLAIGYDLANTILLETPEGNVVIDVGMTVERATEARAALAAAVPGDIAAVIYTHSHIDHVGGALAWADEGTPIWATDAFVEHFVKQYGQFAPAESARGNRQFGAHLDDAHLPCSALGRRADPIGALDTGALLPTHTFSGSTTLEFGGVSVELHEAHGETHDQLYVWIPHLAALLPGDNYYAAFPNLYTIRGTSPRPVDAWIRSLDRMRSHDPALLVPSHTIPVVGRDAVRDALRNYRDAIQWVRDEVVRGANAGHDIDTIVASVALPEHLAARRDLDELYGQVDWSARAIYDGELGWFDGRHDRLYPPVAAAARELAMMGGADAVLAEARRAVEADDPRWAMHLIGKLRAASAELSGSADPAPLPAEAFEVETLALESLAVATPNTNGRAWLFETARALRGEDDATGAIVINDRLTAQLPVDLVFDVLPSRLDVAAAATVETSAVIRLGDRTFSLVVRRGVAEVFEGEPLPGSPPVAVTITTDELTWKRIALGQVEAARAVVDGDLSVSDLGAAIRVLGLFDSGV